MYMYIRQALAHSRYTKQVSTALDGHSACWRYVALPARLASSSAIAKPFTGPALMFVVLLEMPVPMAPVQ